MGVERQIEVEMPAEAESRQTQIVVTAKGSPAKRGKLPSRVDVQLGNPFQGCTGRGSMAARNQIRWLSHDRPNQ